MLCLRKMIIFKNNKMIKSILLEVVFLITRLVYVYHFVCGGGQMRQCRPHCKLNILVSLASSFLFPDGHATIATTTL